MATATATVLFTDVEGSTELRTRLGEGAADRLFLDHERLMAGVVERRGGRVLKTTGDGIMATFDSASEALTAAAEIQRGTTRRWPDLRVRVGLAAGDVSWEDGDCFGLPVVTAARLQASAAGGQILVSNVVRWLAGERSGATFESLGPLTLKGLPEPVEAFAVGWQSADDCAEASVPLPPALVVPGEYAFVGRHDEWATLEHLWQCALDGGQRVALLGGEAGAGKTRLAGEFARRCHDQGAAVLFGACDADRMVPYQPWVQALDQLLRVLPVDELDSEVVDDLAGLAALLPRLGLKRDRRAVPVDPDSERYRLFGAVESVLVEGSGRWPLVLLLDDLHWASAQTLALLARIARGGLGKSMLIIGTFRDTGDELTDPLAGTLADLRRVDGVCRIRVGGLDEGSVASFVSGATEQALDGELERLASDVAARSGGNAFFVGELWRRVVESGVVTYGPSGWVVSGTLAQAGVPDSVREVVADRLGRLDFGVRRLAELVAVAGPRVELAVLRSAADLPSTELTSSLDRLVTADMLEVVEGPRLIYQFTHALVRDTVEAGIPPAARAGLHLRVAEALEAVYESDRSAVLSELAAHYTAAAPLGVTGKAVYYGRQAAEQAMRSIAYDEAIAHLETVLELVGAGSKARAEVLLAAGWTEGKRGRFERAARHFEEAFELAARLGEAALAAEAALGFEDAIHTPGLPGAPAVVIVERAIALAGDADAPLRARLEASLSRALVHAGRTADAERTLDSALRLARASGDPDAVGAALEAALIGATDPHAILDYSAELEAIGSGRSEPWRIAYPTINQLRAYVMLGELDNAHAVLKRHWGLSAEGRFLYIQTQALVFEVCLAVAEGRFAEAEEAAERAFELSTLAGEPFGAGIYGLHMFVLRREQGRLAEVKPILEAVARGDDDGGLWRPGLAMLYAELGMLEEARGQFEALAADGFAGIPRDAVWPGVLAFLAEVCDALGDSVRATVLYDELLQYRGQNLMVAMTISLGPADRLLGSLANLAGDHVQSDAHFDRALALAEQSGSPVWRARVELDHARCLLSRRDAAAAATAASALELADAVGMATVAERASALVDAARPHLVTPVERAPSDLPGGLSGREVDVLRLVASGCSNREIGERLLISGNTAANHVRAILQKTGSANRAEAAAYAARKGLLET